MFNGFVNYINGGKPYMPYAYEDEQNPEQLLMPPPITTAALGGDISVPGLND